MEKGQVVRVMGYGGKELQRRLIRETESTVIICTEEEYEAALREGREPRGVGFPKASLVANAYPRDSYLAQIV